MFQITRILVPTDFSPPSTLATEYAIDMARRYGAAVHLLHVFEDFATTTASLDGYFDLAGLREKLQEDAQVQLSEVAARCTERHVPVTTTLLSGKPAAVIARHAEKTAPDLIVMGTHGRGGFAHLFLGSVAERVVRTASCPVMTVREHARVETALADDTAAHLEPVSACTR